MWERTRLCRRANCTGTSCLGATQTAPKQQSEKKQMPVFAEYAPASDASRVTCMCEPHLRCNTSFKNKSRPWHEPATGDASRDRRIRRLMSLVCLTNLVFCLTNLTVPTSPCGSGACRPAQLHQKAHGAETRSCARAWHPCPRRTGLHPSIALSGHSRSAASSQSTSLQKTSSGMRIAFRPISGFLNRSAPLPSRHPQLDARGSTTSASKYRLACVRRFHATAWPSLRGDSSPENRGCWPSLWADDLDT